MLTEKAEEAKEKRHKALTGESDRGGHVWRLRGQQAGVLDEDGMQARVRRRVSATSALIAAYLCMGVAIAWLLTCPPFSPGLFLRLHLLHG